MTTTSGDAGEPHGGVRTADLRRWGLEPDDIIDFSASINPYGPSPEVRKTLRRVRLDRYPDVDNTQLVEALSARLGIPAGCIVPGNGATELIHAAVRAWSGPGRSVGHCPPTFGEYAAAARSAKAELVDVPVDPDGGIDRAVRLPPLLYLCNPNNPTGQLMSQESLARVLQAMGSGVVVLDEAYVQFVKGIPTALPLLDQFENLVILRSMTKDYGLTALRLGYAVGKPPLISMLRDQLPPWSVNGLAQAAGVIALNHQSYVDVTLERVARAKRQLVSALQRQGWPMIVGEGNFLMLEVGSGGAMRMKLAHRGLLVRNCRSFGLPEYIRIAVRRPGENRRLVKALADIKVTGIHGGSENNVQ